MASGGDLLDVWIDFDGDGTWSDRGEQVLKSQLLIGDMNRLTFRMPRDTAEGGMLGRFQLRCRGRSDTPCGISREGSAPDGEIEIVAPVFRDLRAGPPSAGSQGPKPEDRAAVDAEKNVVFVSAVEPGSLARVEVKSGRGILNAWIDFNRNGTWTDPGERIFDNLLVLEPTNSLPFRVPNDAVIGPTQARFRFHGSRRFAAGEALPLQGLAADGEAEDHGLDIVVLFFRDGFESGDRSAWSKDRAN